MFHEPSHRFSGRDFMRFRCICGCARNRQFSAGQSIPMRWHAPSRSEAICRYVDGLVRAKLMLGDAIAT